MSGILKSCFNTELGQSRADNLSENTENGDSKFSSGESKEKASVFIEQGVFVFVFLNIVETITLLQLVFSEFSF